MKNEFKNKKILITGGAGFVGSFLTEELIEAGAIVVVVDDFSNGRMENLVNIKDKIIIIKQDITQPLFKIKKIFSKYDFDGIFHLACHPRSMSLENPFRDLEVNSLGTLNMLELAREKKKCKFVFTSNSGIYGNPDYLPIDEKHTNKPSTPYDANKLVSEYYAKIYYSIYDVPIAICRLATVYGERQRATKDWKPVIAEFAEKILNNKQPTINWDGKQTRDLIYVRDVTQGLIKAFLANTKDNIFLLSTNKETSINEIYNTVNKALNKNIKPKRSKKIDGDIRRMKLSYKKANKYFGFKPKYTLKKGVKNYLDWINEQK